MKNLVYLVMIVFLVFCSQTKKGKKAEVIQGVEFGIESISNNADGTLDVSIYMYNTVPVAGFQADILPKENFEITGVTGGVGEELGFMMQGGKSTFLGFSMKGDVVPESSSSYINENILCHLTVNVKNDITLPMEVTMDPIIAGKRGTKIKSFTKSFLWK